MLSQTSTKGISMSTSMVIKRKATSVPASSEEQRENIYLSHCTSSSPCRKIPHFLIIRTDIHPIAPSSSRSRGIGVLCIPVIAHLITIGKLFPIFFILACSGCPVKTDRRQRPDPKWQLGARVIEAGMAEGAET